MDKSYIQKHTLYGVRVPFKPSRLGLSKYDSMDTSNETLHSQDRPLMSFDVSLRIAYVPLFPSTCQEDCISVQRLLHVVFSSSTQPFLTSGSTSFSAEAALLMCCGLAGVAVEMKLSKQL